MKQPYGSIATRSALIEFWLRVQQFLHSRRGFAKEEGLSTREYELMLMLKALGSRRSVNVSLLAERLFIQHHIAAAMVKRLTHRELVTMQRSETDRRSLSLRLTAAGEDRLERIVSRSVESLADEGPEILTALTKILREDRRASAAGR